MTKHSDRDDAVATPAERGFVEEFGVLGESMGMPRMVARLWAWMLICNPPRQSSADIGRALGISRASVSTATRLLMGSGLIRRSAVPGERGHHFESDRGAFLRLPAAERFAALRRQFDHGLEILDDPDGPRGARLRAARDFYAYMEAEVPRLLDAYRAERAAAEERDR